MQHPTPARQVRGRYYQVFYSPILPELRYKTEGGDAAPGPGQGWTDTHGRGRLKRSRWGCEYQIFAVREREDERASGRAGEK